MVKFKALMKRNKEGLIIGGGVGAAFAFYLQSTGANFLFAAESPGLLNEIMSTASKVDIATAKLYITYIVVGMVVGFIIDMIWKPGK